MLLCIWFPLDTGVLTVDFFKTLCDHTPPPQGSSLPASRNLRPLLLERVRGHLDRGVVHYDNADCHNNLPRNDGDDRGDEDLGGAACATPGAAPGKTSLT